MTDKPKTLSEHARDIAKKRWANISPEERRVIAMKMVEARKKKALDNPK